MPVVSRLVSIVLRVVEIICAAIVAGIIGYYLGSLNDLEAWPQARWIYTEVVAVDVIISLAWFAAFGILVDAIHKFNCGSIWAWGGIVHNDVCGRWKAAEAFSFISACVWLVSAIVVRTRFCIDGGSLVY
ncbi:hypothetical protein APSETT445_004635 [Aspergillus pseudonomiae]